MYNLVAFIVVLHAFAAHALPLPCFCQIRMERARFIDGVSQTYRADFTVLLSCPSGYPRALLFTDNTTTHIPVTPEIKSKTTIPRVEILNSNDIETLTNDEYVIRTQEPWMDVPYPHPNFAIPSSNFSEEAWYFQYARFSAVIQETMNLVDFPFDKQTLHIQLQLNRPVTQYQIIPLPADFDFVSKMESLVEFELLKTSTYGTEVNSIGFPFQLSTIVFTLALERIPTYYYMKIIAGIVLLVVMTWSLFVLDPRDSNRVAVAATVFLAMVSYLFLVSNDVPKVPYSTRLDDFILFSMINVFLCYFLFCMEYIIDDFALRAQAALEEEPADLSQYGAGKASAELDDLSQRASKRASVECETPQGHPDVSWRWHDTWFKWKPYADSSCFAVVVVIYVIGAPLYLRG